MPSLPLRERLGPLVEREYRLLFSATTISTLGDAVAGIALAFAVLDLTGSATDLGIVIAVRQVANASVLLFGGASSLIACRATVYSSSPHSFRAWRRRRLRLSSSQDMRRWRSSSASGALRRRQRARHSHGGGPRPADSHPCAPPAGERPPGALPEPRLRPRPGDRRRDRGRRQPGNRAGDRRRLLPPLCGPDGEDPDPGPDRARRGVAILLRAPRGLARVRLPHLALVDGFAFRAGKRLLHVLERARPGRGEGPSRRRGGVGHHPRHQRDRSRGRRARRAPVSAAAAARRLRLWPTLYTLQLVALALGAPTWLIASAAFFGGLGIAVHLTLWFTVFQREIPERAQSRVSAYDSLGSFVLTPLGTAIAGPVAAGIGTKNAFWLAVAAILALNTSMLLIPSVWSIRRVDA